MQAKHWTLRSYPKTETQLEDFALVTLELPPLKDGEALGKVGWIGLAPSLRFRMTPGGAGLPVMTLGDPITSASGVGLVLESKRDGIATGDIVYGDVGWADYANIGHGRYLVPIGKAGEPLTNPRGILGEASPYLDGVYRPEDFIGLLGGVAMAAWIGLRLVETSAGETVVVTAAAGGIGHVACQLAQLMGLNPIGLTRDPQKAAWLRDTVGIRRVIDLSVPDALDQIPQGYGILFENAGGAMMPALISRMGKHGRVALCGVIAEYETGESTPFPLAPLVFKDITVRGYFADDYLSFWGPALDAIGRWISESRILRGYDIEHGLERLPQTYLRLFRRNTNRGKLILRVADL